MVSYVDGIPNDDFQQPHRVVRQPSVDDHFAFFKRVCDYATDYYLVRKAKSIYGATKNSCGLLERTLNKVENGTQSALDYTAPIYENYVFPTTNRLYTTYSKGVENTKAVATTTSTVTFGLAVVSAEMFLTAGVLFTRLILDGLVNTKNKGEALVSSAIDFEKYVEHAIRSAIDNTFQLVKNPSTKIGEHANTFLDIANSVFDRILSLPAAAENPDSTLRERVSFLAKRIGYGVSATANRNVMEPCQVQLAVIAEQLQKSFVVVEFLKESQAWTFQKVDNITASTAEFRTWIETEAKQLLAKPEDALIRYIHEMSKALAGNVAKLRDSGELVFNEKVQNYVQETVDYVTEFSGTLQHSDDLYSANSEVVDEVKKRLFRLTQWYKQNQQQ